MFMFAKLNDSRSAEEMIKFNQVIDARLDDKIALRFWMSGLPGVEYQLNNSNTISVAETTKTYDHHSS